MKRTITGLNANGSMSLGDLRQFLASLDGLPDDASSRPGCVAQAPALGHRGGGRPGFRDYIRSVGPELAEPRHPSEAAGVRRRKSREVRQVKQTASS